MAARAGGGRILWVSYAGLPFRGRPPSRNAVKTGNPVTGCSRKAKGPFRLPGAARRAPPVTLVVCLPDAAVSGQVDVIRLRGP